MKTKITNEMLAKYFSGNCSDQEKQEVEHWKEISEDNSRVFEEMKALWRNAFITNTYNPDPEASLHKVNSKLGFFNKEKAPDSKVIGFHVLRFTLRAAAALLIICAGYWFFHQYTETTKHQVPCSVSAIDQKKIDFTLKPESSEIEQVTIEGTKMGNDGVLAIRDRSTAVARIELQDLQSNMTSSVEEMLQGRIGNVDITSVSGDPGAGLNIRIRGTASLNARNNPLIVVNGIPYDTQIEADFDFAGADIEKFANLIDVSPEEIESIEVLKDSATISKYGAAVANGVIYIKTKKGDMKSVKSVVTVEEMLQGRIDNVDITSVSGDPGAGLNIRICCKASHNSKNYPLIVVNGIRYDIYLGNFDFATADRQEFGSLIDVSPEDIESIEVLKDTAAISKYGAAAANGVIYIKTKKGDNKSFKSVTVEEMMRGRSGKVDISSVSGDPGADLNIPSYSVTNNPMITVNGTPYAADLENFDFASADNQKFANLIDVSPEDIESIEVLKDAATIKKYGAAAANGVIYIKTKKGDMKSVKSVVTVEEMMQGRSGNKVNTKNGKTFKIEDLKRPNELFYQSSKNDIFKTLILSVDYPYNIVASSNLPDSLVTFGFNSFFYGMYQVYADHRPFVLSPDMIWLLISQGFSRHVNLNAEELRKYFVDFSGKIDLIVRNDNINLNDPKSPWELVFPEFTNQIGKYTGKDLIDVLSSNFTTTTAVEKVASEITIMEAMKPYFNYTVIRIVCGIPEITLEGTTKDWQKVLKKAQYLRKYELGWWIDEIEPLLKKFVKASKGEVDTVFWRNMFKIHSQGTCGSPEIIDGWIVKFFPYDKKGKRNSLKEIKGKDNLPQEIVKVDLKFVELINGQAFNTPLELWAGFFGLEQDKSTFSLKPKIGWLIRKKDTVNFGLKYRLEKQAKDSRISIRVQDIPNQIDGLKEIEIQNITFTDSILIPDKSKNVRIEDVAGDPGIRIRVQEIPNEIFGLKEIRNLDISFTDSILVPDKLKNIKIGRLSLSGKMDKSEIERISKMFPDTKLIINREIINAR